MTPLNLRLIADVKALQSSSFPKLKLLDSEDGGIKIDCDIDMFDVDSNYIKSCVIRIENLKHYPYCVPTVNEIGQQIWPRGDDRHIDKNGEMCLDIPHNLILKARTG